MQGEYLWAQSDIRLLPAPGEVGMMPTAIQDLKEHGQSGAQASENFG